MRARGLKLLVTTAQLSAADVAPHAGAWIETAFCQECVSLDKSRPMRARGLKLIDIL